MSNSDKRGVLLLRIFGLMCPILFASLVVFVILKLCGILDWSWAIVLIPGFIMLGVFVVVAVAGIIAGVIVSGRCDRYEEMYITKRGNVNHDGDI